MRLTLQIEWRIFLYHPHILKQVSLMTLCIDRYITTCVVLLKYHKMGLKKCIVGVKAIVLSFAEKKQRNKKQKKWALQCGRI